MSDFNKEQIQIFIHNFFTVIGFVGSFNIYQSGKYYLQQDNVEATICFSFSFTILTISMWLLITAMMKSLKPFIESYLIMITQMEEELELRLKVLRDIVKNNE